MHNNLLQDLIKQHPRTTIISLHIENLLLNESPINLSNHIRKYPLCLLEKHYVRLTYENKTSIRASVPLLLVGAITTYTSHFMVLAQKAREYFNKDDWMEVLATIGNANDALLASFKGIPNDNFLILIQAMTLSSAGKEALKSFMSYPPDSTPNKSSIALVRYYIEYTLQMVVGPGQRVSLLNIDYLLITPPLLASVMQALDHSQASCLMYLLKFYNVAPEILKEMILGPAPKPVLYQAQEALRAPRLHRTHNSQNAQGAVSDRIKP